MNNKLLKKVSSFHSMAEVSVICKRTVLSTKPVQQGEFSSLSPLGLIMEHNNLRLVFYYDFPKKRSPGELTKELIESISVMLCTYPIVTGRLLRMPDGRWTVKSNDAGLRLIEAKANGSVDEWLQNVDRENELKLVYWEEMYHKPYFWSPFYVQGPKQGLGLPIGWAGPAAHHLHLSYQIEPLAFVLCYMSMLPIVIPIYSPTLQITEFESGGLAIGLSCTHLLSDPISATMMIKAWADTTLKGEIISPPLFHPVPMRKQGSKEDIDNLKHQNFLINYYKSVIDNPAPASHAKQTTISFQFDHETIQTCIAMAAGNTNSGKDREPNTPFEALAALFWSRISKIKGKEKNGLVGMSICMDIRNVLNLDKGVFGNFMVCNGVGGDGLDENNVYEAAAFIKGAISQMNGDEVVDLIEWLGRENYESPPWMNGSNLICFDLENVESYFAVYEDSVRPTHVSYYIEPAVGPGQIVVLPPPRGDGRFYSRVVSVTLPEDEAGKLIEDALINQLGPTILMGLNKKHTLMGIGAS
ncbi:hypothetical protein OROHE_013700 [Orobanche hederae]